MEKVDLRQVKYSLINPEDCGFMIVLMKRKQKRGTVISTDGLT